MSFFKTDNKYIYLDCEYAEFYIPKFYFEDTSKFAVDMGSIVKSIGIFDVGIFQGGKLKEMHVLNLPSMIEFTVYDSEDRDVILPKEEGSTPCKVIKYHNGNRIMDSALIQDSTNVELYMGFILKGKVPAIVPYEESLQIWRKNQAMNGVHLGVPSVIEEMILFVSYRDKQNPGTKFAHAIGKDPNKSQYDYVMNNIRQICQYSSTFTAMTFEDIDAMITTSVNRTRTKGNEAYSPIEDLFKL